jgi:hypothetical protein
VDAVATLSLPLSSSASTSLHAALAAALMTAASWVSVMVPASERKLLLHVEPIFIEPAVWRLLFERDDIEAKDPDLKLGFFINSNLLLLPWTIMRLSSPAGNGLSCAGLSLPWISNPTALAFSLTAVISGTISTLQAILIRYGLLMA